MCIIYHIEYISVQYCVYIIYHIRPSFRNVFKGGQKWTCDIRGANPRAVCVSTQPFRGVWGHAPPQIFSFVLSEINSGAF